GCFIISTTKIEQWLAWVAARPAHSSGVSCGDIQLTGKVQGAARAGTGSPDCTPAVPVASRFFSFPFLDSSPYEIRPRSISIFRCHGVALHRQFWSQEHSVRFSWCSRYSTGNREHNDDRLGGVPSPCIVYEYRDHSFRGWFWKRGGRYQPVSGDQDHQ